MLNVRIERRNNENRTDPVPILCMYEYQSSTTGYDGNEKAIDLMQGMYDITFVYDSSLVTAKPQAFPSAGNSLKENLERILAAPA